MATPQAIVSGLYFLVIFAVGLYATRFVKDSTDFLLAGRRLGVVLAAAALAAVTPTARPGPPQAAGAGP